MKSRLSVVLMLAMTVSANAQPITGKAAKKALISPKGAEVSILAAARLPENQATALAQVGAEQPYFGAIAISPDEGLMSAATFAAVNYHNVEAASIAAVAECDSNKTGKTGCVVAALITPKGWTAGGFQLSREATMAFRDSYPKKSGALAISNLTGVFGLAEGADAAEGAVAACAGKSAKAVDCTVVIAE